MKDMKGMSRRGIRQKWVQLSAAMVMAVLLAGCGVQEDRTKKVRDLEFEVLAAQQIPEELQEIIEEKKQENFKLTFTDQEMQYICVGYGQQPTGGYSISVTELYETENAVYVHTNLMGPSAKELKQEKLSYPYIVIRLEKQDKTVVFE